MNNLNLFEPFEFYRGTRQFQFFENEKKHTHHTLVSVLAPSIEEEFTFLKSTQDIVFRYLSKYFIDQYQVYKTYPSKRHRVEIELKEMEALISSIPTENKFPDLDVIINRPRGKNDLLKGKNTLYEINYVLEKLRTDEKDRRRVKDRRDDLMMALGKILEKSNEKIGPEYRKVLIIPVHLWLEFDQYKDPDTFKVKSDNMISHIYNYLTEDVDNAFIFEGWDILLVNHNEIMILDTHKYLNNIKAYRRDEKKKGKFDTLESYLKYFLKHCRTKDEGNKAEPDARDLSINRNMDEIAEKSKAKATTEKLLEESGLKKEDVPEEQIEEIENLVTKKIQESGSDEIKLKTTPKDVEAISIAIQATLSKQSRESYARNQMLKKKYGDTIINREGNVLTLNEVPEVIKPIALIEKDLPITVINEDLKKIVASNFSETYNKELYDYDLASIIGHFATCDPPMYPISDLKETDISDDHNRILRYEITFEDGLRNRHNLKFQLPKFYQEKFLFLNGSVKYLTHQKIAFPITKIREDKVQLGSNYNKIFISRAGNKVSPKIIKLIKFLTNGKISNVKVIRGDSSRSSAEILTTVEYDEMIKAFTEIRIDKMTMYFDLQTAVTQIGFHSSVDMTAGANLTEMPLPIAIDGSTKYYLRTKDNVVIDNKDKSYGQLSDFMIDRLEKATGKDNLSDLSMGKKYSYSEADIMNEKVPVILLACTMAPGGLVEVLDIAQIKYEFHPGKSSVKHDKLNQGNIKFQDGVLIYDLYPYENSLLLNGLQNIPTREYSFLDFTNRETFLDIYDLIFGRRNLIEAIENFRQLFMDPITKQVSLRLSLPIDIVKVVLYGNDLLADNNYTSDVTYYGSRIRKNEIVMVYLYKILSTQYGKYRINPDKVKFTIPEDAVIKEMLSSRLTDEYSKLNQPLAIEMDQEIKGKGPFGLNVDQAYTLDRRAYEKSMLGIVGSATAPSGEVGIKRHLALGANITDARGFVDASKGALELSGVELLTPGELLSVFSNEKGDATRAAMATNQSKQILPTMRTSPDILSYGMDKVVPYINDSFSNVAKQDGKVLEITEDIMIVQYKDGSVEDIDLSGNAVKHTNSAKFFVSHRETSLKEGKRFKAGDLLAYDPTQIKGTDIFGDAVATTGVLANVAFISTGESYEDSMYLAQNLADDMASLIAKEKSIKISKFSNIRSIVKKGDEVKAGQPLLIYDDTGDVETSEMSKINRDQKEIFDELSNTSFKTDISGKVVDVKIYYGIDEEELSESIRKTAKEIQKHSSKRRKVLEKHGLLHKSNTLLQPDGKSNMDSTGRIKGIKVEENVLIEFVIEYLDIISSGDKTTAQSAVKGICSHVIPTALRGYPVSDPDFKADVYISTVGVVKRMAHDINISAIGNKIVVDHQRNMKKRYGAAVKRALGKK